MNLNLMLLVVTATILSDPQSPASASGSLGPPPASQPAGAVDPELVKRLLDGESSTLDAAEETIARMERASRLLKTEEDCGERTQKAQADVLAGIDKLIEEARKAQVGTRGGSNFRRKRESKPGRRQSVPQQGASTAAPNASTGQESGQAPAGGEAGKGKARRSDKAELSRGWGFLPQRDRDEIAQGFDEEYVSKYREQIVAYYRHLAEEARRRADEADRRD